MAKQTSRQKRKPKAGSNGWLWFVLGGVVLALVIWVVSSDVLQPVPAATRVPAAILSPTPNLPVNTQPQTSTQAPSATAELVVTEFPTPDPAVLVTADPAWPYPEIPRVSLAGARAALDAGTAVLVDTRSAGSFDQGHAAGAINLPVNEMEALYTQLDPDQWIIPYCT